MTLADCFAFNLRDLRAARGLMQTAFALRAGLSVSYVSMLENGERSPPFDTLEIIGQALEVSPLRLLEPVNECRRFTDQRRNAVRRNPKPVPK